MRTISRVDKVDYSCVLYRSVSDAAEAIGVSRAAMYKAFGVHGYMDRGAYRYGYADKV